MPLEADFCAARKFRRRTEVPDLGSSGQVSARFRARQRVCTTQLYPGSCRNRGLKFRRPEVLADPEVPGDGSYGDVPGYTERLHEKCSFSGYPGSFPDLPVPRNSGCPGSSGLNRNMPLGFLDQCEKVS